MSNNSVEHSFLKSALTLDNPFLSTENFMTWLEEKKTNVNHKITPIKFSEMSNWGFNETTGNLEHDSGKFFSIEGINVKTNWGTVKEWSQPIINQPEIGFLGIITKKIDGVLYFLMQAKIEPGNINAVQLSPTLQATKSNYTQVHQGNTPLYLEYFLDDREDVTVLLDQLQSEQGARFLKKRNRNIIIEVTSNIEVKEDFCWLTLGQIKELLTFDNVINMDTRTVISGIPYGDLNTLQEIGITNQSDFLSSELDTYNSLHNIETVISWITKHKAFAELEVNQIPLNSISDWTKDDESIYHKDHKYFSVIAVKAEIGNREVHSWTQPLVKSAQEGVIAFIIKKINGVVHFLVQAKLESGNFDIIELAPTVQCLTGNYRKGENDYEVEFLDYVLNPEAKNATVRYSAFQSEEGGRFFEEQNKNMIIEVGDDFDVNVPDKYIWMTLNQIKTFIKFNNYLNIQSRSLLSAINFV
ncbi:MAG: NDP-hexose 2,3-dehydratase family protein [Flavobacteriales bacterium]|nr:NDP-hexose 2,3-dehydratase family protein [Flavobacteriales bacterium]